MKISCYRESFKIKDILQNNGEIIKDVKGHEKMKNVYKKRISCPYKFHNSLNFSTIVMLSPKTMRVLGP